MLSDLTTWPAWKLVRQCIYFLRMVSGEPLFKQFDLLGLNFSCPFTCSWGGGGGAERPKCVVQDIKQISKIKF